MISKNVLEDVLFKYPELIEPGLTPRARHLDLYGLEVDILFEDEFKKRVAVLVRTAPIEKEHTAEVASYRNTVLSSEAPDVSLMLVSDKVPPHLQRTIEHNGVAWKEITAFQIKEFLKKKNDTELLGAIGG